MRRRRRRHAHPRAERLRIAQAVHAAREGFGVIRRSWELPPWTARFGVEPWRTVCPGHGDRPGPCTTALTCGAEGVGWSIGPGGGRYRGNGGSFRPGAKQGLGLLHCGAESTEAVWPALEADVRSAFPQIRQHHRRAPPDRIHPERPPRPSQRTEYGARGPSETMSMADSSFIAPERMPGSESTRC
jgi:hypothetical protein